MKTFLEHLGLAALLACSGCKPRVSTDVRLGDASAADLNDAGPGVSQIARLPLVWVTDVELPGNATRFDYQDIDGVRGHLVIAHMNDSELLVVNLSDGSTLKRLSGITTVRGVAVAPEVNRIFATAINNQLVSIDATTLVEVGRTATGKAPDGVGWDPVDQVVGVSDQGEGALSLIADAGSGKRTSVSLGVETGNVVFDPSRNLFWITVVMAAAPDQLVAVNPTTGAISNRIGLPGCSGAHGLRLHPNCQSAFVACESNDVLARVGLSGSAALVTAPVGSGADVLGIDPGLGWLYVAAESGNLTVFDLGQPGLVNIDSEHLADAAHTVAVDSATHRVFFPLIRGTNGKPVLRIMRPGGT